jgi:hypothetical protein
MTDQANEAWEAESAAALERLQEAERLHKDEISRDLRPAPGGLVWAPEAREIYRKERAEIDARHDRKLKEILGDAYVGE